MGLIIMIKGSSKDYSFVIGEKYGRLTIIEYLGKNTKGRPMVKCRCDCKDHNVVDVCYYNIKYGNTKSCGCYRSEYVANKNKTHGLRYCPIYDLWVVIKQRCYNTKCKDYKYYGNVGVGMSESWQSFENFYDDMYKSYLNHVEKYGKKNTSLDRIDPNGNYCKENCRWATWKEQNDSSHKRNFKDNSEVNNQIAKG